MRKFFDWKYNKIVKYFWLNLLNLIIYFVLYYVLNEYCNFHYLLSNTISYIVSIILAYWTTKKYVFQISDNQLKILVEFIAGRIVMIGLNSCSIFILIDKFKWDKYISQIATTGMCFFISYAINKMIFSQQNTDITKELNSDEKEEE